MKITYQIKKHTKKIRNKFRKKDSFSGITLGYFSDFVVAYRSGTADENVIAHSFDNDIFFKELTDLDLSNCCCIIDVGAHIGTFSLLSAKKFPNADIHAVEASFDSYNLCVINAALNSKSNIVSHRLALGIDQPMVELHHDAGNWGHSAVSKLSSSSETVPGSTLNKFFQDNGIGSCDFIKLNCEGSEFPLILNATLTDLDKVKNMLVIYHCDLWKHNTLDELLKKLSDSGFSIARTKTSVERGWIIASK